MYLMLTYITSNKDKITIAKRELDALNVTFQVKNLSITEIQSDNPHEIAQDKAQKAFEKLHKPLFVTDDSWYITALGNFPGPYMKHVNGVLKEPDFLKLMEGKTNREIILHRNLCFTNGKSTKVFEDKIVGEILLQPSGHFDPLSNIVTFVASKTSVSDLWAQGLSAMGETTLWRDFITWYLELQ